jgi:hypothetical protein
MLNSSFISTITLLFAAGIIEAQQSVEPRTQQRPMPDPQTEKQPPVDKSETADIRRLRQQLGSNLSATRKQAAISLGDKGIEAATTVPVLVAALMDGYEEVWLAARTSLLKLGPAVVAEGDRLNRTSHLAKRLRLLYALDDRHRLASAEIERLFLEAIQDTAERKLSSEFITAVRKTPIVKLPVLVDVLQADNSTYSERDYAIRCISLLGRDASSAGPTLKRVFEDKSQKNLLRSDAALCMASIEFNDPNVAALLRKTLRDWNEDTLVRSNAALAMRYKPYGQPSVPDLLYVLSDTAPEPRKWPYLRQGIVRALKELDLEKSAIPILSDVASNSLEAFGTRITALKTLAQLKGDAGYAPQLLGSLFEETQPAPLTTELVTVLKGMLTKTELIKELNTRRKKVDDERIRIRIDGVIALVEGK